MATVSLITPPIVLRIPRIAQPGSTAERWASYVLGACKSEIDPRTLGIWARLVAVSYTSLCENCRLIGVQPRSARDFARVLRIVVRPSFDFTHLAGSLDISDRRTLESILHKAGFRQSVPIHRQPPIGFFLENQRFISQDNTGLQIIREAFISH